MMRFRYVGWAGMPLAARKCFLRMTKVCPAYDLSLTGGWETFDHGMWETSRYAVNRTGHWYVASNSNAGRALSAATT